MDDIANFEEPFNGAIPLLVSMTDEMVAALNNSTPDTWTFASMPFATVYRLLLLSASVSHSGALCLASAETSLGSAFMIRGLLEAVSHLYYIGVAPDGDNRPPACRALDFEMGAVDEWGDTVSSFPSSPEMRKWHNDHNLKREQMYDIAQELGYPIKKRRWSDVPKTIKTMANTENREWLLPSWRSTSTLVHMYGVDFAFTNHSSGSSDFVWQRVHFELVRL